MKHILYTILSLTSVYFFLVTSEPHKLWHWTIGLYGCLTKKNVQAYSLVTLYCMNFRSWCFTPKLGLFSFCLCPSSHEILAMPMIKDGINRIYLRDASDELVFMYVTEANQVGVHWFAVWASCRPDSGICRHVVTVRRVTWPSRRTWNVYRQHTSIINYVIQRNDSSYHHYL